MIVGSFFWSFKVMLHDIYEELKEIRPERAEKLKEKYVKIII